MKWKLTGPEKLPAMLDRFKYPILILLAGIVLLLLPNRKQERSTNTVTTQPTAEAPADLGQDYRSRMEKDLEALLSQIDGAGRVRILLTLKTGPASNYERDFSTDERTEGEESSLRREEKTVILNRGNAYDEPAVVSTAYPVFQGALIVAEGGADPGVRLRLSAAVAALLDLGADQITVVKMK